MAPHTPQLVAPAQPCAPRPRPRSRRAATDARRTAPVDLYLVWALRPHARLIGPDGAWSVEPVPVRRDVRLAELAPLTIDWPADPVGAMSVALVAVEPGAHPVDRSR